MLTGIDHIDLKVPNLDEAVAFLSSLGMTLIRETPAHRGSIEMALPGAGQVVFEIRQDDSVSATTLSHVAFASTDSEADIAAFKVSGLTVTKELAFIPGSGRTISNVVDPSGLTWQLTD